MSRNIPKALRQQVWMAKMGENYKGKCTIHWCKNMIDVFNFHCGHDEPHSKGGAMNIDNLHPICVSCNLGMGNKHTIQEWNDKYTRQSGCLCGIFTK